MNTADEGFSLSFHKNYKLGPTYPRHPIFSLRELHQTTPSAWRAETSSQYQSDPPENQIWHTDEAGASLACYQSTLISGTSFFSQWYFPLSGRSTIKICKGSLQALLSSAPRAFTARSHVLARPVSLAQTGEIARRLAKSKSQDCWVTFKPKNYLEIMLSAYARTSQANILHLDQKAPKCMTCKWLCGK